MDEEGEVWEEERNGQKIERGKILFGYELSYVNKKADRFLPLVHINV